MLVEAAGIGVVAEDGVETGDAELDDGVTEDEVANALGVREREPVKIVLPAVAVVGTASVAEEGVAEALGVKDAAEAEREPPGAGGGGGGGRRVVETADPVADVDGDAVMDTDDDDEEEDEEGVVDDGVAEVPAPARGAGVFKGRTTTGWEAFGPDASADAAVVCVTLSEPVSVPSLDGGGGAGRCVAVRWLLCPVPPVLPLTLL